VFVITGASGFVGRHLCKRLIEDAHKVKALIRREDAYLSDLGVECIISDLWDKINYKHVFQNTKYFIHCAGDATFGNGLQYKKSNSDLTYHIITNVQKYSPNLVRFVYLSSIGAVDRKRGDRCKKDLDEESICVPSSDYGRSKLKAEEIVRNSTIPYSIVRPCMVVGNDMRFNSHFSVFIRSALSNSLFSCISWPGTFSVIHVDDLVQAILTITLNIKAEGETFFCAGSEISIANSFDYGKKRWRIQINWFVKIFRPLISYLPFRVKALLLPALVASDKKLMKLGWEPSYTGLSVLNELVRRENSRLNCAVAPSGITIITGAVSGLGRAFFDFLIKYRENLILIDIDKKGLVKLKEEYPQIKIASFDLTNIKETELLIKKILKNKLYISELYLCAGIGSRGLVKDLGFDVNSNIMDLNFTSRMKIALSSYATMKQNQFGRIIFISSSTAFQPMPLMAVYAASNSALLQLGRAWNMESNCEGISIHTICPGGMDTNFQKQAGVKKIKEEKLLEPRIVVKQVISGIEKNKSVITISMRAKLMALLARILPFSVSDNLWYNLMKKMR
jgi:uncharacterized protein